MGIFDILKGQKADVNTTRSALDQANDPAADDSAITRTMPTNRTGTTTPMIRIDRPIESETPVTATVT